MQGMRYIYFQAIWIKENEKPNQRESKRRKPYGETGCCSKVIFLCMNENVKND